MVDCICEQGRGISDEHTRCPYCGIDLTPLHRVRALPNAYYRDGVTLRDEGKPEAAKEKLITALSLDPVRIEPYVALGDIYLHEGNYTKAMTFFERALSIEPENVLLKQRMITCEGMTRNTKGSGDGDLPGRKGHRTDWRSGKKDGRPKHRK